MVAGATHVAGVGRPFAGRGGGCGDGEHRVSVPDPVLDKASYQRDLDFANQLEGQARIDALAKLQPAHQARNHAASPVVPTPAQ